MKRIKSIILATALAVCILVMPAQAASDISDVPESHWAYPYASYMVDAGIMPLEYGNYFNPSIFTTRGEFVLYLWRAAGAPDIWVSSPTFTDVSTYDEYYYAVEWAVHNNITTGTSSTRFSPDYLLTREQAFTFLWRAMPFFNYNTDGLTGRYINGFADAESVSSWAWQAMNGLCALGIVGGEGNYLMPLRDVANSETAAILYRTLDLVDALYPTQPNEHFIEFNIYNESDNVINAIYVMPAYTDGPGVDILPYILHPGESYYVQLDRDFVYADSSPWSMSIMDFDGYTTYIDDVFSPKELAYVDVYYSWSYDEFYCDFVY